MTGVNASKFPKKATLVYLKSSVDKIDVHKLTTAPTDLSKLSIVVDNGVVKKTVYDELIKKLMLLIQRYKILKKY